MDNDSFAYDVFLSHSSRDKTVVRALAQRLRKDGLTVWFDEWELSPGDVIPYRIDVGLERSRVLILCISRNSISSDWAELESGTFRFRDPLNKGRRFVPIRLDDVELPGSLRQVLYLDWTEDHREANYVRLFAACRPPAKRLSNKAQVIKRLTATKKAIPAVDPLISAYALSESKEIALYGRLDGVLCSWLLTGAKEESFELAGHRRPIKAICWNEKRQRVLTGSVDRTVRLWDMVDRCCVRVYDGHAAAVNCVIWALGHVVSCSQDGNILVCDEETGETLRTLVGHAGAVHALASHGNLLVSAGQDRTIRIWNLQTGRCLRVLEGHTDAVRSLQASPDGSRLLSGSEDNTVRLWELGSGLCENVFDGHTAEVRCISWHANARIFVSGSGDRTLRIWDAQSAKCLRVLDGHQRDILAVKWRTDATTAISGDTSGILHWRIDASVISALPLIHQATDSTTTAIKQVQYTNAKVLLVGESGAGKTGLSKRLSTNVWEPSHQSTVGAWATQWSLPITNALEAEREIWLWDFGGQADQRLIHQLYMDETSLAVLVFDGQKQDVFDSLTQWDHDLDRASSKPLAKLLVAGRIDAGAVRASRTDIDAFVHEKSFKKYLETSALTNQGCEELRAAIVNSIDWDAIPWRSSPALFKRLKEEIVKMKDEGRVLMRVNELRDAMKLRLGEEDGQFTDLQLKAVLSLLAGPGVVAELEFGGWVLFQPELINAYGQAVIHTMRADQSELGCINEERVLNGDLVYHDFKRIEPTDERFVLLAMHRRLLERGLCSRELTDTEPLLVFPSYYRRQRPTLSGHPAVLVSYRFNGVVDEIYSTLVVRLHHTRPFRRQKLWQDAAEFTTDSGAQIGVKLSRRQHGVAGLLEVYCDSATLLADKIVFIRYVHEHLRQKATSVQRRRHYVCVCSTQVTDLDTTDRRRNEGKSDIGCSYCDGRIPLMDDLELQYSNPLIEKKVRGLDEEADEELDNESKERALVGEMISTVALAGQICREKNVSDHGIDMEIEFKDDQHRATGELLFLQLKSGDSYLRTRSDEREIFSIRSERHADYWMRQKVPVLLVIRDSTGVIRWMEIRDYLKEKSKKSNRPVRQIEFSGEVFNATTLLKWRRRLLFPALDGRSSP